MAFSASALNANRAGRLAPDQLRDLQAGVRYRSRGLVGHLLHGADAVAQDVASGQVFSVEGAITKKMRPGGYGGDTAPPSYQIWVANRQAGNQQFKSDKDLYNSAPDGGFIRLFYLPQSKWAVNFEWLPVAPPQDRLLGESAEQALLGWRAAHATRDVVGEAEARAGMASIRREVASYLPETGLPAHEQLPPDRLRAEIIGDWQSPFLSISVRADGTLTATMDPGAVHAGRWSVDPAGRVVTDVMGASMAIDASIAGDVLTLVIDGEALNLRRSRG